MDSLAAVEAMVRLVLVWLIVHNVAAAREAVNRIQLNVTGTSRL